MDWLRGLNGRLSGYRTQITAGASFLALLLAYLTGVMGYEEFSAKAVEAVKTGIAALIPLMFYFLRAGQKNDEAKIVSATPPK